MENWQYLLVDERNRGALCCTADEDIAVALMSAFPDTTVIQFPFELERYRKYSKLDFNRDLWHISLVDREVTPLPENLQTEDFRARRIRANEKLGQIRALQIICQMTRLRSSFGFPSIISADLQTELDLSNPENNHFSLGIHEYAAIRKVELPVAYRELKMKVESSRLLRIRNFAIYEKYLQQLCETENDTPVFAGLMDEVLYNSFT